MTTALSVTAIFERSAQPKTDFNGDGRPDLCWRHATGGLLAAWFMDGINQTGSALLNPSAIDDLNWQIVGMR
jgi:hypothetical protein